MMSYKRACWFLFAGNCLYLGFGISHDSYNVFLAVGAVLISYGTAVYLFAESKPKMVILFVFLAVALCQISVIVRTRTVECCQEDSSIGSVLGDVAYGFYNIPQNVKKAVDGLRGDYDLLNEVNYRLLTLGMFMPAASLSLLLRRPVTKQAARRRVKDRPSPALLKAG